jgi:hypothetical protein
MYLLPEFLSYMGVTYLFVNIRTGAKKVGSRVLTFGVGPKILGYEQVGIYGKNIFLEFGIFI